MLVLVSFALVLVATVLLVLGLMSDDGLTLIYISIACSAAAGLVLLVAVRLSRPKAVTAAEGPAPLAAGDDAPTRAAATAAEPEPAAVASSTLAAAPAVAPAPGTTVVDEAPTVDVAADDTAETFDDDDWDGEFPIAEYDDLKVSEIMPLLPELYPEELDIVEERELATKNRASILARIEELRDGEDDEVVDDDEDLAPVAVADDGEWEADDDGWDDDAALPISGYDSLTASDIKPRLADLSPQELTTIRAHETANANRSTVVREIDRLSGDGDTAAATRAPAAGRKAAPRKAASRATAARKTVAKQTAARKTAARKTAARQTAAKRTAVSKTAVTKKSATKKAAAAKKATPAKRASAAKKATKAAKKR